MEQLAPDVSKIYTAWRTHPGLEVVFQPLVHIASGTAFGFEALSRPTFKGEALPIGALLESASQSHSLADFDRVALPVILETASLFGLGSAQLLFINLSPFSLLDPDFILGQFQRPAVSVRPDQVVIEISERESLPAVDITQLLAPFRTAGMAIALDDFGAGYSGLTRMVDMAPDYAKIDLSLVRDIDKNVVKHALVESTVQFAGHSGQLQLIAEGIETAAEQATLHELGVQLGQGYLLGRPEAELRLPESTPPLASLTHRAPDAAEQLEAFINTSHRLIAGIGSGDGLASHIVHLANRLLGSDFTAIWKPSGGTLQLQYAFPELSQELHELYFAARYPSYVAMAERRTLVFQSKEELQQSPLAGRLGLETLIMVPVLDHTKSLSLLTIGYRRPAQARPQDIRIAEGLARLMALGSVDSRGAESDVPGVGEPVFEAMSGLMAAGDMDSLLAKVAEAALSVSGGHMGYIGVLEAGFLHGVTPTRESFDLPREDVFSTATDLGRGPIGRALRGQRMVVVQDVQSDPTMAPWRMELLADGIQAALAIPLRAHGRVLGLLKVYHSHRNGFETARIRRLEALASLATTVIEKWQDEHSETRQWLRNKTRLVYDLMPLLLNTPDARSGYRLVQTTVERLMDATASGIVSDRGGHIVPVHDQDGIPEHLIPTVVPMAAHAMSERCLVHETALGGSTLFVLPLMAGGRTVGALWVVTESDGQSNLRVELADRIAPHLMILALAAGTCILLEESGH